MSRLEDNAPAAMCQPGEVKWFVEELYREKPKHLHIQVFTLPSKRVFWCLTSDDVVDVAARAVAEKQNVYIGAGLSPRDYGSSRRCPAEHIAAIAGLWADVDYRNEVHTKPNLPPGLEQARELIRAMGPDPTIQIDTGYGIQAWWLFKELWVFESECERQRAAELSFRWSQTLKAHAAARGWTVDSVHDLSRVMRLPGTLNLKRDTPKNVRQLDCEH